MLVTQSETNENYEAILVGQNAGFALFITIIEHFGGKKIGTATDTGCAYQ